MVKGLAPGSRVQGLATRVVSGAWARNLFPETWETQIINGVVVRRATLASGKPSRKWLVRWDAPVDDSFEVASSRLALCAPSHDSNVVHALSRVIHDVVVAIDGSEDGADSGDSETPPAAEPEVVTDDDEYADELPHLGEAELYPAFDKADEDAAAVDPGSDLLKPHGLQWTVCDDAAVLDHPQAYDPHIIWLDGLGNEQRSQFDFYMRFHHARSVVRSTVRLTNKTMRQRAPRQRAMTVQEYFQLEGILLILAKHPRLRVKECFEPPTQEYEFETSPQLQRYMLFSRYQTLVSCLTFAERPRTDEERLRRGMFWKVQPLVDGHNDQRRACYHASGTLVADETECPWHGRNQKYADHGCAHCQSIIRKPQGIGVENKDLADAVTGVVLRIEPVGSKEEMQTREFTREVGSGTGVLLRLTKDFRGTKRHVVADSAFASVKSAVQLHKFGLYFTGAIKRAHAKFPKKFIEQTDRLRERGDSIGLTACDEGVHLLATGWREGKQDKKGHIKRKLFVSTCGSSGPGRPHMKKRFKISGPPGDTTVMHYEQPIPRPAVVTDYFDAASKIDESNHLSQGIVRLFKRRTHRWEVRYWMVISIGVNIVDAFKAWVYFHPRGPDTKFKIFWRNVVQGLLDNTEGTTSTHVLRAKSRVRIEYTHGCGSVHELQPLSSAPYYQERKSASRPAKACRICHNKAFYYCPGCTTDDTSGKLLFALCGPKSRRTCFHQQHEQQREDRERSDSEGSN